MKIEKDKITMSDGTTYYANMGILGIADDLEITYGYDGSLHYEGWGFEDDAPVKADHRREMAEYMIALWTRWRDASSDK